MEYTQIGDFVQTSFSIGVAAYLLLRMETRMGELNESIQNLVSRFDQVTFRPRT